MNDSQSKFIRSQFVFLSMMAAFQRTKTYRDDDVTDLERKKVRAGLERMLDALSGQYRSEVSHEKHVSNIEELAETMTSEFGECLCDERFRIGVAQKALNLYLKYLWCVGEVMEPPDCPFDSIVIDALDGCGDIKWTRIDKISTYEKLCSAARNVAGDITLANWELEYYNQV